jgi:flagellum-specific ATP synthase
MYEELAPMVRANLYERGRDAAGDKAIDLFPQLDGFVSTANPGDSQSAFKYLESLLGPKSAEADLSGKITGKT